MSAAWEGLKSIPARISSWWSALWAEESTEQAGQSGDAQLGAQGQGAAAKDAAAKDDSGASPDTYPARTETGWMVVRDANAILRQGGDFKAVTPARTLPLGASVRVIQGSGPSGTLYVQVETAPGAAEPILASDNLWTAKGNLGHGGADHKLGNEAKDEADKSSADTVRDKLPPGRNPGASPYTWSYGSDFATTLEGVAIKSSLLDKVIRMAEWAIANDMVTGNIELGSGMRSPATAHQWATAYQIQFGGDVTQKALEALPGGKDMDGNLWWKEGWTMEDAKRQANRGSKLGRHRRAWLPQGRPAPRAAERPQPRVQSLRRRGHRRDLPLAQEGQRRLNERQPRVGLARDLRPLWAETSGEVRALACGGVEQGPRRRGERRLSARPQKPTVIPKYPSSSLMNGLLSPAG
ncbi:MAG: hypothetical protein IPO67_27775 [Deltaproteobacteria bacterium]|nr:hypothetical protein [Deltaproteobacteria bacterium]